MSIVLSQMPSAEALYLKAATTVFKRPKGRPQIPSLELRVENVGVDARHLSEYREVCGFADSEHLPITFPHVMAGSLHLQLLTARAFPVPLLGLVHIRNRIEQSLPMSAAARYNIYASVGESRDVRQGMEFDLLTRFEVDGELAWTEVSTMLFRMRRATATGAEKTKPAPSQTALAEYQTFDAPTDTGRRYARVGKDYNPIHLSPLPARLFGFKRHIAHGMWSLARCAALLEPQLGRAPQLLDVQFKQPLFLPGKVALRRYRDADAIRYALLARHSDKVHLAGTLR